jgi:hypothetical protein
MLLAKDNKLENDVEEMFVLPAEAWKDYNMLDWVISIKS